MKIHMTTDYGIRVMCCLYSKNKLITANEISEQLSISYGYLNKVLGCLREAGMIEVVHGRFGGYQIAERSREVTLYDIIQIMEGDIQLNSCLGADGFCNNGSIETCLVHGVLRSAQKELIDNLRSVRLSEISGTERGTHERNKVSFDHRHSMYTPE